MHHIENYLQFPQFAKKVEKSSLHLPRMANLVINYCLGQSLQIDRRVTWFRMASTTTSIP